MLEAKRRILVVEDEPTIADAVAARLRAEGFDGRSRPRRPGGGRRRRAGRGPTWSCSTSCCPGFDGLEVCRRIQAERRCRC